MASTISFDVVSEFDRQELVNAIDQVRREVGTRYDFKGAKVSIELSDKELVVVTDSEMRSAAIEDLVAIEGRPARPVPEGLRLGQGRAGRGPDLPPARRHCARACPRTSPRRSRSSSATSFPRSHGQIQGDAVRVSGKSKDDLQAVIARLREVGEDYPVALQFKNYR